MSGFNPAEFGRAFHEFVTGELAVFGFLAPFWHVITIIVLVLVFFYGNRFRKLFTIYFTLAWLFLFGYWGIYGIYYWIQVGIPYFMMYCMTPVLLGLIVWQWVKEDIKPTIDLDFHGVSLWKWWVLIITVWGFWYPAYIWGQGMVFQVQDLLYSNYGSMPCPTTMVVLSLMTLNYPRGNRTLFNLLTAYAIFLGGGSVAAGWMPDIPFVILGLYCLGLIVMNKLTNRHKRLVPE